MRSQTITLRLQDFWEAEGCLTVSPYSILADDGLTPALFFGALREGAWRACQLEEVVGFTAYGHHPGFRLHRRFQVILKGEAGEVQDVYLAGLQELGIDPGGHDIRLVPETWNSPCLAAHGCGWQVQIDWLRIGSIVYLRKVGNITPAPLPIRATYDLEPLFVFLREDIGQTDDLTMLGQDQRATYLREHADVTRINSIIDLIAIECDEAINKGLFIPAYDCVLACQRLVELLAARRERPSLELSDHRDRVAQLAHRCADAYLEIQHA